MLRFSFTCLTLAFACLSQVTAHAEKAADIGPGVSPSYTDSLDGSKLSSEWAAAKGDWSIVDGAILGKELEADKHAAVLTLKKPNHNSTIAFSFQLNDSKTFHLSYNKAKGHLFRVLVTGSKITISLDKDKSDPKSKPIQLATTKADFKANDWHSIAVSIDDDTVNIKTDNGVDLTAKHADLNQPKTGYRFITRGDSLKIDDVKVWKKAI